MSAGGGVGEPLDAALVDLADLAGRGPLLVALDFDGVCAPLVDDPADSRMLPGTRTALHALTDAGCHVALVSGRSLDSLLAAADPEPGWLLVGGHGAEVRRDDDQAPGVLGEEENDLLTTVTAEVEALVAAAPGSVVERKPTSVVLHTRRADADVAAAVTGAVLAGPAAREGVHLKRGHDVVELAVVVADKGTALLALRERAGAVGVLYAGDDVTDEDAFAVLATRAGDAGDEVEVGVGVEVAVGVKVGAGETAAGYRVADPAGVTALLERLVDLVVAHPCTPG